MTQSLSLRLHRSPTITTTYEEAIGIGRAQTKPSLGANFVPGKGKKMSQTPKSKNTDRGQRHSAAWGKRLGMLFLLLIAHTAFAQTWGSEGGRPVGKFAPDLAPALARAHQGLAANETVHVIVQYKQVPKAAQEGRMQRLGARLNHRLGMVKGIALTIPASALPALEADPEVVSVTVDHPMKGLDDITDVATSVTAAWDAGYNGAGIGVAVIDSGINDTHPDLWDSTESHSRVVYHQDFTGTATSTRVEQRTTFTVTVLTSPESLAAMVISLAGTTAEWRRA